MASSGMQVMGCPILDATIVVAVEGGCGVRGAERPPPDEGGGIACVGQAGASRQT